MSKDEDTKFTSRIVHATKEAREIHRLRSSFTFNLGMEIIRSIKNPFLILFLPFRIVSLLFIKKTAPFIFEENTQSGILLIGIDRIGDNFSLQAQSLGEIISESNLGKVSLFNNSSKPPMNLEQIEWYRLPSVREKNKSRKDWNIMIERSLSSVISISCPKHVIYFGDYLYRGVIDALGPIDASIPITWFLTNSTTQKSMSTEKLSKINLISLPEFSSITHSSQSIHRILRRSESEQIVLIDVDPKNTLLLDSIMEFRENHIVTAVQREYSLPKGIDLVVRMKEIVGMQLEGNVILVVDDKSPLLPSLAVLNIPCLLLRTGAQLSPIINEMIRDLELKGNLVVVRRNSSFEILQGLQHLNAIPQIQLRAVSSRNLNVLKPTNYVLKWLEKSDQSYN